MTIRRNTTTILFLVLSFCLTTTHAFQLPTTSATKGGGGASKQLHPSSSLFHPRHTAKTTTTFPLTSSTQLAAASPAIALSQLGSISVLAFVILVHEAGHYLAARSLFQMKVEEFSIGVGPKLWGFTKFGNDFSLRAIPLGGYVKFPENYNTTLAMQLDDERFLYEAQNETKGERTFNNILSLGTYEARLESLERQEEEKRKKEQTKNAPFWKKLFTNNNNNKKQQQQQSPTPPQEIEYYDDPDLLQNRPWPQRAVVIAGGVIFNFILAFALYFAQIASPEGLSKPILDVGARVSQMPSVDAPVYGKLQTNDVILGINGVPLMMKKEAAASGGQSSSSSLSSSSSSSSPTMAASSQAIQEFIQTIRATPEGDSLQLQVRKGEKVVDITVKPKGQVPSIGAMLAPNAIGLQKIHGNNLLESSRLASECVGEITTQTFQGFTEAVGKTLGPSNSKNGGGGGGPQLSGPIGLLKTGSDVVSTAQWTAVLTFAAAISVNLAVVNSLPLPALDGGQMVFVLAEAVSGKKVNQKVQETVTFITILLLLGVTLSTTVGDVQSIFLRK